MKIEHIVILFLLFSSCSNRNTTELKCNCSEKIPETVIETQYKHCTDLINSPEQYDSACSCINKNSLVFPTENVVSGILYKNCEPNPSDKFTIGDSFNLDKQFVIDFRTIISDTSNFIWGEPGTPYTDYIILFFDSSGAIVNKAEISFDHCLDTYPQLGTIKCGGLSNKGLALIKLLIFQATTLRQ